MSPGAGSARQPTVMKTCGKVIDLFHFIESTIVNMSCRLLLCVVSVKKRVTTGQGLLESTEKNPDPPKPIPVPRQKKRCCFFFIRLSRKRNVSTFFMFSSTAIRARRLDPSLPGSQVNQRPAFHQKQVFLPSQVAATRSLQKTAVSPASELIQNLVV